MVVPSVFVCLFVSPAGSVGAAAAQRCPPDTRALSGEAKEPLPDGNDLLPNGSGNTTVDKGSKGGIISLRNDGHTATHGEDGKFTGSEPYADECDAFAFSIYYNSSEDLYKYAKKVKPEEGYEDVFIHGDKTGFSYNDKNGNEAGTYSPKEFADILKNQIQITKAETFDCFPAKQVRKAQLLHKTCQIVLG